MTEGHVTSHELERIVLGERTSVDFEAHVAACAPCARALEEEARLELVLRGLAEERRRTRLRVVQPTRRSRLLRDRGYLIGAALAATASMLFIFHSMRAVASMDGNTTQAFAGSEGIHGQPSVMEPDGGLASPSVLASLDAGGPARAPSPGSASSL
jgi:hypothetical protein